MMRIKFEGQQEKYKIVVMSILLAICCYLVYYFHVVAKTDTVFTHFFYVPIILSSFWWRRKGVVVAIFLVALLVASHLFLEQGIMTTANDFLRAIMFIASAFVVAMLSERMAKTQEIVREKEKDWSNSFDSLEDVMLIIDKDYNIENINDSGLKFLGKSKEEIIGKKCYKIIHNADGSEGFCPFEKTLKTKTVESTERYEETLGRHFLIKTSPIFNEQGEIVKFVDLLADITERKQAEEREEQLQQALSISSRLAAVGELAAGVAHEINNPLTGVLGFSERLLRKSTDEETRRDLERIHSEAQRITRVMDNLRTFTRRREPEKYYLDINDILHETLELRAYVLRTGNIEVVTDLAPGLPEIEVDSHQIQEVFLNIILNAEQVMAEAHSGGKLTIKTQKIKNHVRISFADDGPGILAEHLDKLFDPFFTTRGEKGGTGLGLSVCYGIVAGHDGRLYAKSKPGEGATFSVELPYS